MKACEICGNPYIQDGYNQMNVIFEKNEFIDKPIYFCSKNCKNKKLKDTYLIHGVFFS